jgi:opioid growth factor receptor-like protein
MLSSRILEFYRHSKPDFEGRMLSEYWEWNDQTLESVHDFIQWMFPLDEPSAFNPDAPLLTAEDRVAFAKDPRLQNAVWQSLQCFLAFLGLEITPDGSVGRRSNFNQRLSIWRSLNHNWLRITRVLKSLRLLGMDNEAREFWKCLAMLHDQDGYVTEDSFNYWRQAAEDFD